MDILADFQQECEKLAKGNGRRFTLDWIDQILLQTITQLKTMPLDHDDYHKDKRLHSLEQLLLAIVVGSQGLDARASIAWRNVGLRMGLDYVQDLAPLEDHIANSLLALTGHQKEKNEKRDYRRMLRIVGVTVLGGAALAMGGALGAAVVGSALAGTAATTSAFLTSTAGISVVAGLFGAVGANRTAWKMLKREGGLKEFVLLPVRGHSSTKAPNNNIEEGHNSKEELDESLLTQLEHEPDNTEFQQKLQCAIGISGWLQKKDLANVSDYWLEALSLPTHETWTVIFDRKVLEEYGNALRRFVLDQGMQSAVLHAAVLAGGHMVMAAATPPGIALMLQDVVDSPFAVAKNRAKLAGQELARAIMHQAFGRRPLTLVGFGFGSTAIVACLEALAAADSDTEGFVKDVVLFGSPIRISPDRWSKTTRVVSGKYINCFCTKDVTLSLLLRLSTSSHPAAGIQAIKVPGIRDYKIDSTAYDIGTTPGLIHSHVKTVLFGNILESSEEEPPLASDTADNFTKKTE